MNGRAVPEYIAWVGRLHAGQWQACYDAALARNPYVEGAPSLHFVIARDGSVSSAQSGSSRHSDPELDACLVRVARAIRFSQPEGGVVDADWTLDLSRTRGAHLVGLPLIRQR